MLHPIAAVFPEGFGSREGKKSGGEALLGEKSGGIPPTFFRPAKIFYNKSIGRVFEWPAAGEEKFGYLRAITNG